MVRAGKTITAVNRSAVSMFGRPADELVGLEIRALLPEIDVLGAAPSRLRGVGCDRERFPVEVRSERFDLATAQDRIVVVRDLTEGSRVERRLEEALERFRQITEQVDDLFFIVEPATWRPVYLSPAFEPICGRDPAVALEHPEGCIDLIHPQDRDRCLDALETFRRGDPLDLEFRIVRSDGEVRTLRARAHHVAGEERVAGVATDVTQERALEQDLQQSQRLEAIGNLASGIAHDFNNLLMGVVGFASIALQRLDPSHGAYPMVRRVVEVTSRGKTLTRQLLDFSRKRQPERVSLDIDAVVDACAPLLETLVGEHIEVLVQTEALGCRVKADVGEIEQILMNLAANSRDSMPGGGTLEIRTKEIVIRPDDPSGLTKGRYAELVVRDTGSGMDGATASRLFEPFFTTKAIGRGTGLGLFNVRTLVKRMGGAIRVASRLGVGTTFTILIPAVPETGDLELPADMVGPKEGTILAVEDDPLVRTTVAHYLENLGFRVLVAAGPREAVRLAQEYGASIDVLLTDIMMPQQLGSDLARTIQNEHPHVRVAYMSAHEREELLEAGRIEPGAPLLQKPFDQRSLAMLMHRLMKD